MMGMDKGNTVMVDGMLATMVGDVKGVLGGDRDVADVSLLTRTP
jgi:hypothetical protein